MARLPRPTTASDQQTGERFEVVGVALACAVSAALGLLFVFVRSPHPWGWSGFDHYDDLGARLARGEAYGTLDRMWGYPIVLAILYRASAGRIWPVLIVQVALNAVLPAVIYAEVRERVGSRIAMIAAWLVGALSLNTVYASTQSADALCTIATVTGVAVLARAERLGGPIRWVVAGLLLGAAAQFRPNVLLLPIAFAALLLWRGRASPAAIALMVAAALLVDLPWVARNYRVAARFIPATTHGGLQLWYGSVQVPPYYAEWTRNPDAVFEANFFDYSPAVPRDVTIAALARPCEGQSLEAAALEYRPDTANGYTRREPERMDARGARFTIPRPAHGSAIYYYFDARWRRGSTEQVVQPTPLAAAAGPLVHFIADDDLHDLDAGGDLLDVYDVARMMRHIAWREPLPHADRLDLDGDGAVTAADVDAAIQTLTEPSSLVQGPSRGGHFVLSIEPAAESVVAILRDHSSIEVPRQWSGAITDLRIAGALASDAVRSRRSLAALGAAAGLARRFPGATNCLELTPTVDGEFWIREPKMDDRYRRLAWAQIAKTPGAFAVASLRRIFDLFVVSGPSDAAEVASKGSASRRVYRIGRVVTGILFVFLVAGLWIAWRQRRALDPFWIPIVYVPITICYLLANMRYTVTVQPFEFVFVAIAVDAAWTMIAGARPGAAPR